MTKKLPELTLFMPVYNEEGVIKEVIGKSDQVLKKTATKYEIVAVNDGSKDKTPEILTSLKKKYKNLRVINQKNKGYGGALLTGLKESKLDPVSFIDSDGQFDFGEINKFTPHLDNADLVIGYRLGRQDTPLRKLNAFLWKLWMWALFGLWVNDTDCGFKVIKKEVVDKITPLIVTESAITEAEFLIRAKQAGYRFHQVGVRHYPRTTGTATGANPKVILKAVKESLKLWYLLNFTGDHDL